MATKAVRKFPNRFDIKINKSENTIELQVPIAHDGATGAEKKHFNILQITDLHYYQLGLTDRIEMKKIRQLCIDRSIDLVVCTGDMFGRRSLRRIKSIMKGFDSIIGDICPWTFAWGNHDCEVYRYGNYKSGDFFSVFDKAETFFEELPNLLYLKSRDFIEHYHSQDSTQKGVNESALNLNGVDPERFDDFYGGNFRINIKPVVTKSKPIKIIDWNLFILNSRGAHHIPENALDWIEDTIKKYPYPSLMFYHVPNLEYVTLWDENRAKGIKREKVCNELEEGYIHKRFKQLPQIKGCFVGHDHVNDYYGVEDGIIYSYGRKTGKNGYGSRKEEPKVLKENVKAIKTGAKLIRIQLVDDNNGEKLTQNESEASKSSIWSFKTVFFDGSEAIF